jgi:tetratricopeptide (TPR) repeat protein
LDAEDHLSRRGRARAAAARKMWEMVISDVDVLRAAEQASVEDLILQAHARSQLAEGSPEEALADLDAAVDLAHTTGTINDLFAAYKARGMFRAGLGQTEDAAEDLSRARAVRPSLADPEVESILSTLGGPR